MAWSKLGRVLLVLVTCALAAAFAAGGSQRSPRKLGERGYCEVRWIEQDVDHFGFQTKAGADPLAPVKETYMQRYFICADTWAGPPAPIFFYLGNEDNVELYMNNTGLMWESAPSFGALLVFAEHRYYGDSRYELIGTGHQD